MGISRSRAWICLGVLACCLFVLAGRLFFVQVIKAGEYAVRSRNQSQPRAVVAARRGSIRDCRGRILARSIERRLDAAIELPDLGRKRASGTTARVYPFGDLAGTVLGYVGRDGNGMAGAEYAFDSRLRGEDGWAIMQRDGRNVRYSRIGLPRRDPVAGHDVYLTIDVEAQRIAQTVLGSTVASLQAKSGMCMIMDPASGDIIAMAEAPSFNPNVPSLYPLSQRTNRCVSATYEPGSTFKVVTAAIALQEGVTGERDILNGDNGAYKIYDTVIRDRQPFGRLSFAEALAASCNICFVHVAEKLGNDRIYRYVKDFGFGAQSGLGLPGEERGIVKPVSEWSGRTGPTMAIGQEISVTLLQMMLAFACVANDGVLVEPRIVRKTVAPDGRELAAEDRRPVRRVMGAAAARTLRSMMQMVVDSGTGRSALVPGVAAAGKTGTSQKVDSASGAYSMSRYWSSFFGFMPVDKPVLVCGIVIDEPSAGQSGGVAAAPAFRRIMTEILSDPDLDFAERILPHGYRTPTQVCAEDRTPVPASRPRPSASGRGVLNADISRIPDCLGSDARDAAAALLRRSIVPFVNGFGVVTGQSAPAGGIAQPASVCTLYCSLKG